MHESGSRSWHLAAAYDIRRGDIAAFVGGGGKTTAMFRLAGALAAAGWGVLTTTTTHIGREQSSLASRHLVLESDVQAVTLKAGTSLLVTGPLTQNDLRWGGVPSDWVAQAISLPGVDAVLVEADGARCLPFKAPAAHEPVVPPSTTLLIPVVGIDAVGKAVQNAAHRPEQVAILAGIGLEEPLTPEAVARVLVHRSGGLKGMPDAARARSLINKVETKADLATARILAHLMLSARAERLEAVLIGAMAAPCPVREIRRHVAAIVLAAGRSVRMGGDTPKQMLPWKGTTVIHRIVDTLVRCSALVRPPLVVTGHQAEKVRSALSGTGAQIVHNPNYEAGEMLSSLQAAIRALDDSVSGCLVVLGDQPWLELDLVEKLMDAYAAGPAGIIAPAFRGRRGHPVIVDRRHWPALLALDSGLAPRHLLQRHLTDTCLVPVGTDSVLRDMDTLDEYRRACSSQQDTAAVSGDLSRA